jgi:hypothetical protein
MGNQTVSQNLLKRILQTRAEIEALEKTLKEDEASVFASLKAGTPVARGIFTAVIETKAGRRTTAWKERAIEFVDETRGAGEGAKWAERVIAATKPGDPTEKLVVKVV